MIWLRPFISIALTWPSIINFGLSRIRSPEQVFPQYLNEHLGGTPSAPAKRAKPDSCHTLFSHGSPVYSSGLKLFRCNPFLCERPLHLLRNCKNGVQMVSKFVKIRTLRTPGPSLNFCAPQAIPMSDLLNKNVTMLRRLGPQTASQNSSFL